MAFADRSALEVLAREVARLLSRPEPGPLLTARDVAERFNVDRNWVYAHAVELGVIRLGTGPRPRLRFDAAVVAQRLLPASRPAMPARGQAQRTSSVPLLPIRPTGRRRRLDTEEARDAT